VSSHVCFSELPKPKKGVKKVVQKKKGSKTTPSGSEPEKTRTFQKNRGIKTKHFKKNKTEKTVFQKHVPAQRNLHRKNAFFAKNDKKHQKTFERELQKVSNRPKVKKTGVQKSKGTPHGNRFSVLDDFPRNFQKPKSDRKLRPRKKIKCKKKIIKKKYVLSFECFYPVFSKNAKNPKSAKNPDFFNGEPL